MFNETFTLTKKHLGWLLVISGLLGFVAVIGVDVITLTRANGFSSLFTTATLQHFTSPLGIGPAQRLALSTCSGITFVGITLIPLGGQPA